MASRSKAASGSPDVGTPFLTELDERARVKGSRDPLGYMSIWGGFGRRVVGNLTTQTVSVRGFTTLLLGYWFAERVRERPGGDDSSTLDVFLRFEQLAGYCRYHYNADRSDFRGIRRVAARLQKGGRVTLGTGSENQILSSQKLYGLWGLYTVAARVSGFLQAEPLLTPAAAEFVDAEYAPALRRSGWKVLDNLTEILSEDGKTLELDGRHATLGHAVADLHRPKFASREAGVYRERLVFGGEADRTQGLQRLLADHLRRLPADEPFGMLELEAVIAAAGRQSHDQLVDELEAIRRLEHILAPSAHLFDFVLTRNRERLDSIAAEARLAWGEGTRLLSLEEVRSLRGRLEQVSDNTEIAARVIAIGEALGRADYADLVRLVVAQNEATMRDRDGSQPWATVENGRLNVRLKDESRRLPDRGALRTLWRNPYFISSLKMIQSQLEASG